MEADEGEIVGVWTMGCKAKLAFQLVVLSAILGSFIAAMSPLLDRPFLVGHEGFNGAMFSMSAVNMLRFGLVATRAAPTRSYWQEYPPRRAGYYTSKPYGHPLLVTAAYALFGVSEKAGRSVSLAFCVAIMVLLFFFGRQARAPVGGLAAAATVASLPMVHHFGSMLTGQIPSLLFVVGLYCSYAWYLRVGTCTRPIAAAFFVSLLGGGLLEWHIFSHLPVIVIHFAWINRREPRRACNFALMLAAMAAVPLALFALHTYWLDGFSYFVAKIKQRTGITPAVSFTWADLLLRQWHYLFRMYTPIVLLLALLGLLMPAGEGAGELQRAGRLAAVAALGETALINEAIYIHIYYTFIWILPVSFALGSLVERLSRGPGGMLVSLTAAVLLGSLFAQSCQSVRAAIQSSAKQSLPLIRVAQNLGGRLREGEKVILFLKAGQFDPQIRFYLKREFLYPRSAGRARALVQNCRECRFLVVKGKGANLPNSAALRKALMREYPHETISGYYVFTLPSANSRPSPTG